MVNESVALVVQHKVSHKVLRVRQDKVSPGVLFEPASGQEVSGLGVESWSLAPEQSLGVRWLTADVDHVSVLSWLQQMLANSASLKQIYCVRK